MLDCLEQLYIYIQTGWCDTLATSGTTAGTAGICDETLSGAGSESCQ